MRLWWLRLGTLVAGMLLVGLTAGLIASLQWGDQRDARARADVLRARVVDELERELTAVVDREEAHPFLHYRSTWSPGGDVLVESPLARGDYPDDVVGYVQQDPEGNWTNPLASADAALGLVQQAVPPPAPPPTTRQVRVNVPVPRAAPVPDVLRVTPPVSNSVDDVSLQLNRSGLVRQQRGMQTTSAPIQQVNVFATGDPGVDSVPAIEPPVVESISVVTEVTDPAPMPALDALDVDVTPLREGVGTGQSLALVRDVRIGERVWTQAVLLDREALQRSVTERVLDQTGLADLVQVDWSGTDYHFAAPFTRLSATIILRDVQASSLPLSVLWTLGAVVALLGLASLVLVERSASRLVAAGREREQFIATVTHELKTPVASMQLYAEMLDEGMASDPAQRQRYFGVMRAQAARLARLVEQTLALTADGTAVHHSEGPVVDAVQQALDALAPVLAERDVVVDLDVRDAGASAPHDPVVQIVTNLVDNASKFLREGDRRVVDVVVDGRSVCVRDRGPGVHKAELRRIFEPFHRVEDEATRSTQGSGLGLAVCARLAGQMGGRVTAERAIDGGLVVCLRW